MTSFDEDQATRQFYNPEGQVMFRAGLIAARESLARFVAAQSPEIAASIRANWWPYLGEDFGHPRKIAFQELTEGEYGQPGFRCKDKGEISPTLEALPIALQFLVLTSPPGAYDDLLGFVPNVPPKDSAK